MDRRRFLTTAIAAPLLVLASRTPVSAARPDGEIRGTLRRLTEAGRGDNRATFMPDGKTLLFASKRSGRSQIWAIDRDGGHPRQIHQSAGNDYGRVAVRADGNRLCLSSDRSGQNLIYIHDLASGRTTLISDPAYWSFGPTWSSRDLIAFFSRKGGNVINVWTVRPDGTQPRQITDQAGESRQPWWSPDGATLAFSANRGTGTFDIWLAEADGSNMRAITRGGSFEQPFWSPSGKQIAVSARIGEPHRRIYVMNADGSDLAPINQPANVDNVHPAWSPDGRSIVFTAGTDADGALYIVDLI
jgi:Tol biopolymer transport system component